MNVREQATAVQSASSDSKAPTSGASLSPSVGYGWPWLSFFPPAGSPLTATSLDSGSAAAGEFKGADALAELQRDYFVRVTQLWNDFLQAPEKVSAPIKDSRFSDPSWQKNPLLSFYARAYLLNAEFLNAMAAHMEADAKTKARLKYTVQQWVDAVSPSNFPALNPRVQQRLIDTHGESLTLGLQNLFNDVAKGKISQADDSAFEVGRNVGTSEGMVVFENPLIQLIQYKPMTEKVNARPFLIVPPCINKFYILDLQPDNSLVRYAVSQGHTVFMISWKNPHEPEATLTWDDYIELGPLAALRAVREIANVDQCNMLGFCVGGTIAATALAVLAARGESPVASLTLLTALLDFTDTGLLDIFVDESQVQLREQAIGHCGLMFGADLANTFSSLRPNDLVWNYVVSNYFEGKTPPAFDLLYWNGDSTNLPGPMYTWYLRNTYLENNLRRPDYLTICGEKIDLRRIRVPTYVFAAREDHIVPWTAAFASAKVLSGVALNDLRFVLGASGHIAGTVNPPSKNKRSYWRNSVAALPDDSESWLKGATEHQGSWWSDWAHWLSAFSGEKVDAKSTYGGGSWSAIEPAPGRYVKEKA